jgi:hypothetical protein
LLAIFVVLLADYLKSIKPYFAKDAMEQWKKDELERGLIGGTVTPVFFETLLINE